MSENEHPDGEHESFDSDDFPEQPAIEGPDRSSEFNELLFDDAPRSIDPCVSFDETGLIQIHTGLDDEHINQTVQQMLDAHPNQCEQMIDAARKELEGAVNKKLSLNQCGIHGMWFHKEISRIIREADND